jgi:replicative DNA helicase
MSDHDISRAVPHSIEAEQAVIAGLLLDNDAVDRIGDLRAEHFYSGRNRALFAEASALIAKGEGADVVTVFERLNARGDAAGDLVYLHEVSQATASAANIARYAAIVREKAQRRGLLTIASDAEQAAMTSPDDAMALIDGVQGKLEKLAEARIKADPVRASEDLVNYLDELERRSEGGTSKAIPTGFADLDKRLNGGIRRGELVIIAARPKMGKSALAFNIARNVAADYGVLILSMEMPRAQIHDRNVAALADVSLNRLLDPAQMRDEDWSGVSSAIGQLERMNLFLDDQGGLRLMDVRMKARGIKRRHGLDLLVVDYLQLMEGEGDNRNAQIESITRGLKSLAKELDIGLILLSQLNRDLERRPNKRPMPSDLRDSGAIEQDCDIALFLYRDEVYNPDSLDKGICEVNVGLIRQGEPGTVGLVYVGEQTKFVDMAHGRQFGREPERKLIRRGIRD